MFTVRIPIFITIKTDDEETKARNVELLPYAFDYLRYHQVIDNCVVICRDDSILRYAEDLGFKHIHKEICKNCEHCNLSVNGIFHYITETKMKSDWFIVFNLNQPFKSKNILTDSIRQIDYNQDFLISSSLVRNIRGLMVSENCEFIEDTNLEELRIYDNCETVRIVDSSIICIKTEYFLKCMEYKECKDLNEFYHKLWQGRYKLISNRSCFINVISEKQVENFRLAADIIKRVEHLPKYKDKDYESLNEESLD